MSNFHFSPSKKFLQLLVSQKLYIFNFGPLFKLNSCIIYIFVIKFYQKMYNIIRISPKRNLNFLTKHELNMNFYIFGG